MSTRTPQQRMTKHELAKQVAAGADLTGEQAKSALDTAFDVIAGELAAGRDVAIAGKFSVSERAAREGRNPATAQTIQIAASRAARFSAAAALKQQLNN
jgi:DNA-binding protein HU-beta